jgi:siderophore ferric iron reductase
MDASPEGAASMDALFELARRQTPLLDGRMEPWSVGYLDGSDADAGVIAALVRVTAEAHQTAGPAYWAARAWSMLIWQPCVLAILAVHDLDRALAVDRMQQRVDGTLVAGYRFCDTAIGTTDDPLTATAQALSSLTDTLFWRLSGIIKIKRIYAERLLADRLLGVMLAHPSFANSEDAVSLLSAKRRWLDAMGLEGASDIALKTSEDGRLRPQLVRKACCLHYRTEPGALCASCPKLSGKNISDDA